MNKKIKLLSLALLTAFAVSLSGCGNQSTNSKNSENVKYSSNTDTADITVDAKVTNIDEFGDVFFDITINDFNNLGFEYGDALTVNIGDKVFENIPYYSGFYGKRGDEQIVAYSKNENICVAKMYVGFDKTYNIKEGEDVKISLVQHGGFEEQYNAYSLVYSDNCEDFDSTEVFANFRMVKSGKIRDNTLYRSASPFDNTRNRADYTAELIENNQIPVIIDLAQNSEDFEKIEMSDISKKILNEKQIIAKKLSADFQSDDFSEKLADILKQMSETDEPYLIHCLEGKDRTGFVCMILEALCGADIEELENDYMLTYKNYFGIDKDNENYNLIKETYFDIIIQYLAGLNEGEDYSDIDTQKMANDYLHKIGLDDETINVLYTKLT